MENGLNRRIHSREHHLYTLTLRHEAEVRKVVDACRVDKRYLTHTYDTDKRFLALMAQGTHDLLKTVACTEEVGTVDLVDLNTFRDSEMFKVAQLEVAVFFLWINLLRDDLDIGGLCHTTHEEQASTDQTHLDGNGEVEDDCQQECHPEHDDVALGILQDAHERTPPAHVIAHNDEHTSQTGHRDVLSQRHEEKEDEQKYGSVDNAGHRGTTTVVDVRHSTGNGTRSGYTAEDG